MKEMKMPTSDSYRESLIESLKDAEHAGDLIGAILEEKDPEPALLRNAIRKVIEAGIRMNALCRVSKRTSRKTRQDADLKVQRFGNL
jgi:DNA-binding phage protein